MILKQGGFQFSFVFRCMAVLVIAGMAHSGIAKDSPPQAQASNEEQVSSGSILAQINDRKITLPEFIHQISSVAVNLQPFVKAQKARFLSGIVEDELLFQEAQKRNLGESPEVSKQLDQVKRKIIVQKLIQDEIKSKIRVSDNEIVEYYQGNSALYNIRERARVSQITVKEKAKAQEIAGRLRKGENLSALAVAHSIDSSKARGGSMGFIQRGVLGADFDKVAFALKPGEISAVRETPMGFQILRLDDYQPAKTRTLPEVRDSIKNHLFAAKEKKAVKEFIDQLKTRSRVIVREELLQEIR